MAGQDLMLSVPADRVPVAVPRAHAQPTRPVWRTVTLIVPEGIALYVERQAQATGRTVEQVLTELVVNGIDAKQFERSLASAQTCPDSREHQRGSINTRHCALCGAYMP
jgi:hypothetical protein